MTFEQETSGVWMKYGGTGDKKLNFHFLNLLWILWILQVPNWYFFFFFFLIYINFSLFFFSKSHQATTLDGTLHLTPAGFIALPMNQSHKWIQERKKKKN